MGDEINGSAYRDSMNNHQLSSQPDLYISAQKCYTSHMIRQPRSVDLSEGNTLNQAPNDSFDTNFTDIYREVVIPSATDCGEPYNYNDHSNDSHFRLQSSQTFCETQNQNTVGRSADCNFDQFGPSYNTEDMVYQSGSQPSNFNPSALDYEERQVTSVVPTDNVQQYIIPSTAYANKLNHHPHPQSYNQDVDENQTNVEQYPIPSVQTSLDGFTQFQTSNDSTNLQSHDVLGATYQQPTNYEINDLGFTNSPFYSDIQLARDNLQPVMYQAPTDTNCMTVSSGLYEELPYPCNYVAPMAAGSVTRVSASPYCTTFPTYEERSMADGSRMSSSGTTLSNDIYQRDLANAVNKDKGIYQYSTAQENTFGMQQAQQTFHLPRHHIQRVMNHKEYNSPMNTMNDIDSQPAQNHYITHKQHDTDGVNQLQDYIDMRSSSNISQDLDKICMRMIEHMNNFGICVIDNFLGALKGEMILKEVLQLYSNRNYSKGRLVNDKLSDGDSVASSLVNSEPNNLSGGTQQAVDTSKTIRNDRVIWVDGSENGCEEINNLIQTLCSVITNSSRLSLYSNEELDKIIINRRTKAHVACYPGNGTRYIKHVDNPNGDGRVITAIYYLNKGWNTERDGGLLRMFPAGKDEVANIEPLFDRVLFFWSDRRNPHEVLPAYRDRYAITVWYIGESRPQ